MAFNINDSINSLTSQLGNNEILRSVFGHPIYVAILMAFCIVIIVVLVMGEFDAYYMTRIGVYSFILGVCVVFLHNKIISEGYNDKILQAAQGTLISNYITGSAEQPTSNPSTAPSEFNIEDSFVKMN